MQRFVQETTTTLSLFAWGAAFDWMLGEIGRLLQSATQDRWEQRNAAKQKVEKKNGDYILQSHGKEQLTTCWHLSRNSTESLSLTISASCGRSNRKWLAQERCVCANWWTQGQFNFAEMIYALRYAVRRFAVLVEYVRKVIISTMKKKSSNVQAPYASWKGTNKHFDISLRIAKGKKDWLDGRYRCQLSRQVQSRQAGRPWQERIRWTGRSHLSGRRFCVNGSHSRCTRFLFFRFSRCLLPHFPKHIQKWLLAWGPFFIALSVDLFASSTQLGCFCLGMPFDLVCCGGLQGDGDVSAQYVLA